MKNKSISFYSLVCLWTIIFLFGSCKSSSPPSQEQQNVNVVVIVIDALRYDHLNCYGYEKNTTSPNIDKLAADGVLFLNAFSQAPWTKPSIASLFTSLYPSQHGVLDEPDMVARLEKKKRVIRKGDVLDESLTTLAEVMQQNGYITASFINNAHLSSEMGFAQGFGDYYESLGLAGNITAKVIEFLDRSENTDKKFFLYLHYIDPHLPYLPPFGDEFFSSAKTEINWLDYKYIRANISKLEREINSGKIQLSEDDIELLTLLYNLEIYWTDYNLGILFNYLKNKNIYNNTWIILMADHGELLYEHNRIGHPNSVLNDELLHIPLVFKLPHQDKKARVIDELTCSIDIMPSVMDYLDLEVERPLMGKSVIDLVYRTGIKNWVKKNFGKDKTVIVSEGRNRSVQMRSDRFKFIEYRNIESGEISYSLFDLKKDPGENVNLYESHRQTAKKYQDKLSIWKDLVKSYSVKAKKREIKKEDLQRLKALGYIK